MKNPLEVNMKRFVGRGSYRLIASISVTFLFVVARLSIEAAEKSINERNVADLIDGAKKEGKLVVWDTTRGRGKEHFRAF
jgi:hypothetical protein